HRSAYPRDRHSFPTRRSSDLCDQELGAQVAERLGAVLARRTHDEHAALDGHGEEPRRLVEPRNGGHVDEARAMQRGAELLQAEEDRKSTRLNSSHVSISYAVF